MDDAEHPLGRGISRHDLPGAVVPYDPLRERIEQPAFAPPRRMRHPAAALCPSNRKRTIFAHADYCRRECAI
jgi:hypothetical protein